MNFADLRDKNEVFSGMTGHAGVPLNITGGTAQPEQIFGELVTGNYFSVLGARPQIGRGFLAGRGSDAWRRSWCPCSVTANGRSGIGGDPSIVGRTINLNGAGLHGRRRDAEGVQGHERDRRAGAVGAVHDLPADDQRIFPRAGRSRTIAAAWYSTSPAGSSLASRCSRRKRT